MFGTYINNTIDKCVTTSVIYDQMFLELALIF